MRVCLRIARGILMSGDILAACHATPGFAELSRLAAASAGAPKQYLVIDTEKPETLSHVISATSSAEAVLKFFDWAATNLRINMYTRFEARDIDDWFTFEQASEQSLWLMEVPARYTVSEHD